MFCGYLKQTCKSITVEDLIKLLQKCKNQQAIIKLNDMTNFYIHFDIDGQFIDFNKQARGKEYGESGTDNKCIYCRQYSKEENCCKCTGEGCLNSESIVDTKTFNGCSSCNSPCSEDTKSGIPGVKIEVTEGNEDDFKLKDIIKIEPPVFKLDNIPESKEGWISLEDMIKEMIDKALVKTLNRMIDSIK